ncbi:hypothetical protein BJY26_003496 [Spelaeicoccus albus]|uniref:Uncharacterized protein n=1 Tax=Spelaeicoccus albus TaxID=1280376 RepID=A0A7Z0D5D5_9MICO|nr:hypothetical protein [Spelaeicoccus albus]
MPGATIWTSFSVSAVASMGTAMTCRLMIIPTSIDETSPARSAASGLSSVLMPSL